MGQGWSRICSRSKLTQSRCVLLSLDNGSLGKDGFGPAVMQIAGRDVMDFLETHHFSNPIRVVEIVSELHIPGCSSSQQCMAASLQNHTSLLKHVLCGS